MYQRFVFLKLKEEWCGAEALREVIEHSRTVLPAIPGVLECFAGEPADEHAAKGWDMCLMLRFASPEDIESYRVHPAHQAFLNDFLSPKVEAKRIWNFAMQELSVS